MSKAQNLLNKIVESTEDFTDIAADHLSNKASEASASAKTPADHSKALQLHSKGHQVHTKLFQKAKTEGDQEAMDKHFKLANAHYEVLKRHKLGA